MVKKLEKQFTQLDKFLASQSVQDDCMLFSELDGYLAAIVVCPDMIMPSEWMPIIWGSEEPVFDSMEQAQSITGAIMALYNDICQKLDNGEYGPYFDYYERTKETVWQLWIEGFVKGMALLPDSWDRIDHGENARYLSAVFRLHELATKPPSELKTTDNDDKIYDHAPDILTKVVIELHKSRKKTSGFPFAQPAAANQNQSQMKVGRNDPCPCGSGKKYKKCCLH